MAQAAASPYAAPNTPIASSKRPRASSTKKVGENRYLDLASPVKILRYNDDGNTALSPMKPPRHDKAANANLRDKKAVHIPSAGQSSASTVVPVALFSPFLCIDDNGINSSTSSTDSCESESPFAVRMDHFEDSPPHGGIQEKENDGTSTPVKHVAVTASHITPHSNASTSSASASGSSLDKESPNNNDEEEESEDLFNPFMFMINLPPRESVPDSNKVCLPPNVLITRPTLVLDLDETLVHCTVEKIRGADMIFPVECNGVKYEVFVRKRPYLDYFLQTVAKSFEVVVFTASQRIYADVLLDKLDPDNRLIHHRLFREACVLVHGNYLKDLTVLGRDLSKTVLVDNSPHAYGYHVDNGIPIESWFDDANDTELLKLAAFLKNIHRVEDVRHLVRDHFKTYQLLDNAKIQQQLQMKQMQQHRDSRHLARNHSM